MLLDTTAIILGIAVQNPDTTATTIFSILLSKVIKSWDLEKDDDVTIGDDTVKETLKKDKYTMQEAYDNAVLIAYKLAGKDIKITKYHNYVLYIMDEAKTGIKDISLKIFFNFLYASFIIFAV